MNLVTMGMKYLGPTIATKAAGMLGIQSPMVVKVIAAALPTILAIFTGKAATAGGAASLLNLINQQGADTPEALEAAIGGDDAGNFLQSGGNALSGLLGGGTNDALVGALGRHAGVDAASAQSLLGLVAPAALGSLKTQVAEQGLDANGLASLMAHQKQNIASAMPAGFADQLSGTGLLDGIQSAAAPTAPTAAAQSSGSGGLMKLALPVVIIGGLAWYFLGGSAPELPAVPEMPDLAGMTEGVDLNVGGVDLGQEFSGVVGGLTGGFGGITDLASAEAAIPGLEAASSQIDNLGSLAGQLPNEAQGAFGGMVAAATGTLRPMIEGVIESSGAGSILQPIADGILSKLDGLAG